MTSTWSSKPFVSYDGPDKDGVRAEVKVATGYGNVINLKRSSKGKTQNVTISVEGLKHDLGGWALLDSEMSDLIQEAYDDRFPIYFRIETRRKEGIDRSIPIGELSSTMELAKENVYKSLVGVRREETDEWIMSPHAMTRLDEDPARNSSSAYNYSLEELKAMRPGSSGAASDGSVASAAPSPERYPLKAYEWVANYFIDQNLSEMSTDRNKLAGAKAILAASRNTQEAAYELEHSDLSAQSFETSMDTVLMVTKLFFPLNESVLADADSISAWVADVSDKASKMAKWAISEVSK